MKMLTFTPESQGAEVMAGDIPADLRDEAELYREQMLEQAFQLFQRTGGAGAGRVRAVPRELVRKVIRDATVHRLIVPVLCGSALDFIGIQPLLDAVMYYLPSPADVPPVEGTDPRTPTRNCSASRTKTSRSAAWCSRCLAEKHGDLYFVRVYSGTLKANSRVLNPGKDKKENVAQLWHIQADRRKQVPSVAAGDIVGIIGPRASVTGDTLCETHDPILLESIHFPETVISMAIEPETSLERKKLGDTLEMLKRQDPTFRAIESEETGQTIISGMGELHLEVIKHRLLRDFNLNVKVHKPRVSYKETVKAAAEALGKCQRQVGGATLFAECKRPHQAAGERQAVRVFYAVGHGRRAARAVHPDDAHGAQGACRRRRHVWLSAVELLAGAVAGDVSRAASERSRAALRGRTTRLHKVLEAAGVIALGADHGSGSDHAARSLGRHHQRPAAAPRDHHQPGAARQHHRARRRSAAVGHVRLLDGGPQPEPGARELFDGAAEVRPAQPQRVSESERVA